MEATLPFAAILDGYDRKPFIPLLETEVYNTIQLEVQPAQKDFTTEENGELIGFRFMESYMRNRDTAKFYFRPWSNTPQPDGTVKEFPSLAQITPEIIAYWEGRLKQAAHPVLVARYAGLAVDFSQSVTGQRPPHTAAIALVNALLETVRCQLYKSPNYAIGKLRRALEVARIYNNQSQIDQVKDEIIKLESLVGDNDKPGLWGFSYDMLVGGPKKLVTAEEEALIIDRLQQRFDQLVEKDFHAAEAAVERLLQYWFSKNNRSKVAELLRAFENGTSVKIAPLPALHQAHHVEKISKLYREYHLGEDAERLLVHLRELNKAAINELKKLATENQINVADIDKYTDRIYSMEDIEIIWQTIIDSGIPSVDGKRRELAQQFKDTPMYFLVSKTIIDEHGRKVAKIGSLDDDLDSNLVQAIARDIQIGSLMLHMVYEEGIRREVFSLDAVMNLLKQSCLFSEERLLIIEKGLAAYFNGDYIVAMHLLIPQFEEAIRNLIEINGGNVITSKEGVENLKTFETLLRDKIVTEIFGGDMAVYFRVLFTDRRGRNLRNQLAHGMLELKDFDKQNTDRVLHAMLCLGFVRRV